jgi:hypothetical protein
MKFSKLIEGKRVVHLLEQKEDGNFVHTWIDETALSEAGEHGFWFLSSSEAFRCMEYLKKSGFVEEQNKQ